ncbi:MAG: polyprenyl synthetase family protein [Deltaproteobacteria bacterium]|nr:polyprenyl synthetase family protein [Deltaproteobacteria bacterium]
MLVEALSSTVYDYSPVSSRLQREISQNLLEDSEELVETERLMRELTRGGGSEPATRIALDHLSSGGKRFRARLALACTGALGAPKTQAIAWAAAVELLHQASLIHDDIQDKDRYRRGQPSLWTRYGIAQAINAGDLLLMLPFSALVRVPVSSEVRTQLIAILAERAANTVRGQMREIALLENLMISPESYLATARGKTGELIALPVHGAALIAGRDEAAAHRLAQAFVDLGVLYQLQDDVLDLYGDKGRRRIGSDLYEGKMSALVVAHLDLHPEDTDWLLRLLKRSRPKTSARDVESAIQRFRTGGALDYVLSAIRELAEKTARSEILAREPILHAVAIELADRSLQPIRHVFHPFAEG